LNDAGQAAPAAPAAGVSRRWAIDFFLLGAIWGSSFLFMRLGVTEFGALPTAAVRVAVAAAFLLPLLWLRGLAPQLARHWKPIFVIGALNSGIPFACFAFALLSISTGMSAILNATVPLFGALIARFWLNDRLAPSRMAGLAIGFGGVALLAWDQASFKPDASGVAPGWAVLACLLATLCYGVAAHATKRYLGGLPALVTSTGSQLGALVVLALPAAWLWPDRMPGWQAWLSLLVVGVLCTGFAYILYFRLIEQAGPARALAVTFLVPVFAVFYGVAFLSEQVTSWMVLCGLVIVLGTALSTGLLALPRRQGAPSH
jgi:drug/metabolite transporter (DMT)-like permease